MLVAILHNIRSLHNVGSMFRTADAAGVAKIYLTGYSPAPRDRLGLKRSRFVKVSLGAEDFVSWEKVADIGRVIKKLRSEGYVIYAVEQDKRSSPLGAARGKNKLALVFGNEVRGLSKRILKRVDKILEIPMRGKKESLNVAVAFGVAVFQPEMLKYKR